MSNPVFSIRTGDRVPAMAYQFGFSLAAAVSVNFSAKDQGSGLVFINRQPAVIANGTYVIAGISRVLTPADGVVIYNRTAGDTAIARTTVLGLFHIIWPGALQETLPSEGYERIAISDNF